MKEVKAFYCQDHLKLKQKTLQPLTQGVFKCQKSLIMALSFEVNIGKSAVRGKNVSFFRAQTRQI